MNDEDFVQFLRAIHEHEVEQAPAQHRLRTPDCPPLSRWGEADRKGWSAEEQTHVNDCPYCQKIQSMQWREQCPSLRCLIQHLADPSWNARAFKIHLDVDTCRRCELLFKSSWLKALARALIEQRRTMEEIRRLLDQAAVGFAEVPAALRGGDDVPQPPLELRAETPGGRLKAAIRPDPSGRLVAEVESPDPGAAGTRVRIELLTDKESLQSEVTLQPRGDPPGAMATAELGKLRELWPRLGAQRVLLCSIVSE